jgi:thiamine-monophosphate kinase
MNKERKIIECMAGKLPRSKHQLNALFTSDAELIRLNSGVMLVNIDEFSQEDRFRDDDAYKLGWNLTAATISDILACCGHPKYYGHSVVVNKNQWGEKYISQFSEGIADALRFSNTSFIGGDLGFADHWHYTGVAIGMAQNPINRIGIKSGDHIFMTGQIGAGNTEAAIKLFGNKSNTSWKQSIQFPFRIRESQFINQFATACMDSSDGLLCTLKTLAELNHTGFEITNTPFFTMGLDLCSQLNIAEELLFMGECGEYELVFTVEEHRVEAFNSASDSQGLNFNHIGTIKDDKVQILNTDNGIIDFSNYSLSARDYEHIDEYINALINYLS